MSEPGSDQVEVSGAAETIRTISETSHVSSTPPEERWALRAVPVSKGPSDPRKLPGRRRRPCSRRRSRARSTLLLAHAVHARPSALDVTGINVFDQR